MVVISLFVEHVVHPLEDTVVVDGSGGILVNIESDGKLAFHLSLLVGKHSWIEFDFALSKSRQIAKVNSAVVWLVHQGVGGDDSLDHDGWY